jgi:hypothetical protein
LIFFRFGGPDYDESLVTEEELEKFVERQTMKHDNSYSVDYIRISNANSDGVTPQGSDVLDETLSRKDVRALSAQLFGSQEGLIVFAIWDQFVKTYPNESDQDYLFHSNASGALSHKMSGISQSQDLETEDY